MYIYILTQKLNFFNIGIAVLLCNYLKIIMKVHKEKLNNFERIIAMMASIFVDTVYSNQSSLNDKGEY